MRFPSTSPDPLPEDDVPVQELRDAHVGAGDDPSRCHCDQVGDKLNAADDRWSKCAITIVYIIMALVCQSDFLTINEEMVNFIIYLCCVSVCCLRESFEEYGLLQGSHT